MPATEKLDALLHHATQSGALAGVVAAVSDRDGLIYEGASGVRSLDAPDPVPPDGVFLIASMTKAVTTAAVMQLVERGKLFLDDPASTVLPHLAEIPVLEGFNADGSPRLRKAREPITLRNLLTHTSGHSYEFTSPEIVAYKDAVGTPSILDCENAALETPLLFDPGERWEYGIGIDWAGKMLEAVTGMRIGDYMRENLFIPLGMTSTSFKISDDQRRRLMAIHERKDDGSLEPTDTELPQDPEFEMSGGGLYGTAGDYMRFARMILNQGVANGRVVLKPETVALMQIDQLPRMACGVIKSSDKDLSNDADFFPGEAAGWGISFLINRHQVPGGRAPNSLGWAGLANSYYWIDPTNGIAAVIATQILPFFDPKMIALLHDFERTVYAG